MTTKRWLSLAETAEYLGKHYDTVRKWHKQGRLPGATALNAVPYVDREVLDKFLASRVVPVRF